MINGDPRVTFINEGTEQISGLELEYHLVLDSNWRLKFNYAQNNWNYNLNIMYRNKVERNIDIDEDDYWLTNLAVRYHYDENISYTFRIENMLDTKIRYPSNSGRP